MGRAPQIFQSLKRAASRSRVDPGLWGIWLLTGCLLIPKVLCAVFMELMALHVWTVGPFTLGCAGGNGQEFLPEGSGCLTTK